MVWMLARRRRHDVLAARCVQASKKRLEPICVVIRRARFSIRVTELYSLIGFLNVNGHDISSVRRKPLRRRGIGLRIRRLVANQARQLIRLDDIKTDFVQRL